MIAETKTHVHDLGRIMRRVNYTKYMLDAKPQLERIVGRYNAAVARRRMMRISRAQKRLDNAKMKADAARISGGDSDFYATRVNNASRALKRAKSAPQTVGTAAELLTQTGYSKSNYVNFSNTKVIAQILQDVKNTLEHHSPILVDKNAKVRASDSHPFNVDETVKSGGIGAVTFTIDANSEMNPFQNYKDKLSELPDDDTDKIRVLVNAISLESTS